MTPQDHNKVIGIMHLIYGGLNALVMLIFVPFILAILGFAASEPGSTPGATAVLGVIGLFFFALAAVFGIPPLLAGYAMLTRKSWGRTMGFISAALCALSFPFGTALCVYTLWFLCGPGEHFHRDAAAAALGAQNWRTPLVDESTFGREAQSWSRPNPRYEYVPPPQPPDWRGE
jgi:hypothetical protein